VFLRRRRGHRGPQRPDSRTLCALCGLGASAVKWRLKNYDSRKNRAPVCFHPLNRLGGLGYDPKMSSFRLPPHDPSTDVHESAVDLPPLSLKRFIVTGGIGFCVVSLFVFGTVAFGQRWMYDRLGVTGAYITWIILFVLLGGRALVPLVSGKRLLSFYAIFGAAFFAYGISWMVAYFTLKNAVGEWLGSFAASVSMALVFAAGFGVLRSTPLLSVVLFVAHSIAYFVGSLFYYPIGKPVGLLLWGAFYGFCLGAGLGAVLYIAQAKRSSGITVVTKASQV
jgi:hypothetical protein